MEYVDNKNITLVKNRRKKEPIFLYACIFALFLLSMLIWIGWSNSLNNNLRIGIIVLMLFYILTNSVPLSISKKNLISWGSLCIAFIYINELNGISFIIPCLIILLLKDENRRSCLLYVFKWYAWLMIPSIITYFIVQLTDIPSFGSLYFEGNDNMPWEYSHRKNYIFYAYSNAYNIRFNGPFLEAGHLGMMSSFLLFATGYNFKKKETWIVLASVVLSLSLAGYILLAVGFLLSRYAKGQISIKYTSLSLIFAATVYFGGILYNNGDNLLNEMIFSRLESDNEKTIAGNNRSSGVFLDLYVSMWNNKDRLLWGIGRKEMRIIKDSKMGGGIGYEVYMVTYGLVGTIMALLFYLTFFLLEKEKRIALVFLLFIILMFLQRTYPFWYSWIICYVYGISFYKSENTENKVLNNNFAKIKCVFLDKKYH